MTPEVALPVVIGVFGLMVGSFLNVCISRIPAGESVVTPRSRCPRCKKPIAGYDNIPVLSYLLLRGRCRNCGLEISALDPAVEIVTALAFLGQAIHVGDNLPLLAVRLVFTGMLIVLFGTDFQTMRLPNVITYSGIVIGLAASVALPPGLQSSLIGAALGAAVPWLIRWAWQRATGVDAMGLGDVKMLAMIGAFLGWQQVLVVLFLATSAGALFGMTLILAQKRSLATKLPFGCFLAMAAYAASLVGEQLAHWYMSLYQF
jgi:leader peptidase (prepilin peptidase)/N-methyltransferase